MVTFQNRVNNNKKECQEKKSRKIISQVRFKLLIIAIAQILLIFCVSLSSNFLITLKLSVQDL